MQAESAAGAQQVHPWMRRLLWTAGGLVLIVGFQLFVLGEHTDRYFAWTIKNPLTAAFLGAAYWASCVLELSAARQRTWAQARIAAPAVLLFTTLTLLASILHLEQFHLGAGYGLDTLALTWAWLGVYTVVPPILLGLMVLQSRMPGGDPPIDQPLPGWLRGLVGIQSAILVAVGAMFFVLPESSLQVWPWPLTPLTARSIGAWLLGLGVAAAQAILENDWRRVRPIAAGCVAFSLLQAAALARYLGMVNWEGVSAWLYVVFLVSLLALGLYGWLTAPGRRQPAQAS